ncbi:class I SAM-dependent methyltransferase [Rhodohalobacter sp. 614A]|uniref:class I SAM-dependent methyltransferase n=1 Tax=Rhodohalobacter sp. 614A TaxID=2908649 RepID=UPI001F22E164|nr:class I SAM-dependent methyltransferase [Rhodohalobacter sp. 614A]
MFGKTINRILKPLGFQMLRLNKDITAELHDPVGYNSKKGMNDFYSDESNIEAYINETRLKFYESLSSLISINKNNINEIVDVGCGTGHLLLNVNKIYPDANYLGLEYAEEAIQRAKKYFPKANYEVFDIYESYDKKFDVVFCTEVLEHLLYPEKAFTNLQAMLDRNGTLIITVPEGRKDRFRGHINFWSPESWKVFIDNNLTESYSSEFQVLEVNNHFYNVAIIKSG